jgi:hypothetical protein
VTSQTTVLVPRAATIDGFAEASSSAAGLHVRDLAPLTTLVIQTRNTRYHVVVSQQSSVFVQGGQFFPEPTAARLEGSSLGGSLLKIGWIGVGLCLELCAAGRRIVTSPVCSILRVADGAVQ